MKRAKSSSLRYNENHHNQHNTEKDEQMAKLNITLNQEEILQLLSKDHDQAFRELLRSSLNSIRMAESTAQLKAELYI